MRLPADSAWVDIDLAGSGRPEEFHTFFHVEVSCQKRKRVRAREWKGKYFIGAIVTFLIHYNPDLIINKYTWHIAGYLIDPTYMLITPIKRIAKLILSKVLRSPAAALAAPAAPAALAAPADRPALQRFPRQ